VLVDANQYLEYAHDNIRKKLLCCSLVQKKLSLFTVGSTMEILKGNSRNSWDGKTQRSENGKIQIIY